MPGPLILRHPLIVLRIAFPEFLQWYFVEQPWQVIKAYAAYFRACNEIFSFLFLIRTLVAPWRQISDRYGGKGWDLSHFAQTLTLNITARVIGLLFRLAALVIGLAVQLVVLAGFLTFLIAWVTFPLLALGGVWYIVAT